MKQYVVCMLYNSVESAPQCVAHFDEKKDAIAFAVLSHKTDPDHNYVVYFAIAGTCPMDD